MKKTKPLYIHWGSAGGVNQYLEDSEGRWCYYTYNGGGMWEKFVYTKIGKSIAKRKFYDVVKELCNSKEVFLNPKVYYTETDFLEDWFHILLIC